MIRVDPSLGALVVVASLVACGQDGPGAGHDGIGGNRGGSGGIMPDSAVDDDTGGNGGTGPAPDVNVTQDAAGDLADSRGTVGDAPADRSSADRSSNDAVGPADTGGTWWRPVPGTSWQIQLAGGVDTSVEAQVFDLDLFDTEPATLSALLAKGRKIVCYFSSGSFENWRSDAEKFPKDAIGKAVGWPGESWLDTRSAAVRTIMLARLDLAAKKGCHGVDPDNVDGYLRDTGFPLTQATTIDYTRFLANAAHARGLAIGLKNDEDLVSDLLLWFDFTVNEECVAMRQCPLLDPFIAAGKAVFDIEYGDASLTTTVCPGSNMRNFDTIIKKIELDAFRVACR